MDEGVTVKPTSIYLNLSKPSIRV